MKARKWIQTGIIFSLVAVAPLLANPSGHHVVSGHVDVNQITPEHLQIQTSDKAIIEWDQFSIADGELTQFIQAGANSAVLNRVTSDALSEIYGKLESNGQVYLINPNGVLIGPSGLIETAAFIASSLDIANEIFQNNTDLVFEGPSKAAVINLGEIKAWNGDIALVGYHVENKGSIEAPKGLGGLAAGSHVLLQAKGEERLFVRHTVDQEGTGEIGALNEGVIDAMTIELKADGNFYSYAIKQNGALDASAVRNEGGRIFLVADEGTASVSKSVRARNGAKGGEINVFAHNLFLEESAHVDASGQSGGGTILIGGDFQGENENIQNAANVTIASGVTIHADATKNGDGGRVSVWGDETAHYCGFISVRGGTDSGNGGFIEVSSGNEIQVLGAIDAMAPNGEVGDFLVDPTNITIGNGTPSASFIDATALSTSLGSGNVGITTAIGGAEAGTITVRGTADTGGAAIVTWSSGNNLTLTSDSNTLFRAGSSFTASGAGSEIRVTASDSATSTIAKIRLDGATISVSGAGSLINLDGKPGTPSTGASGILNNGVDIINGSQVLADGSATITISGEAGIGGTNQNEGVRIAGSSTLVRSEDGAITIEGIGQGSGMNNYGVSVISGAEVSGGATTGFLGSGTVTITGTGSGNGSTGSVSAADNNYGVYVFNGGKVNTTTGANSITGTGGGITGLLNTGGVNFGISVESSGSEVTTTTGMLTLTGTGGNSTSMTFSNQGIVVTASGDVSSSSGAILLDGTGGTADLGSCNGIVVTSSGTVRSTGTGGSITFDGKVDTMTMFDANRGVIIQNGASVTAAGTSTISITGSAINGAGPVLTGGNNQGVIIGNSSGATISSVDGNITITGTGNEFSSGNNNQGIDVRSTSTISTSGDGRITMTGLGGGSVGTSTGNHGVRIGSSPGSTPLITTTSTTDTGARITITGDTHSSTPVGSGVVNNGTIHASHFSSANLSPIFISVTSGNATEVGILNAGTIEYVGATGNPGLTEVINLRTLGGSPVPAPIAIQNTGTIDCGMTDGTKRLFLSGQSTDGSGIGILSTGTITTAGVDIDFNSCRGADHALQLGTGGSTTTTGGTGDILLTVATAGDALIEHNVSCSGGNISLTPFAGANIDLDGVTLTAGGDIDLVTSGAGITSLLSGTTNLALTGAGTITAEVITESTGGLTLNVDGGTGLVSFADAVTVSNLTTASGAYAVTFASGTSAIANNATFNNTGLLKFETASDVTFTGGVVHTAGATEVDATTLKTTATAMTLGAFTATGAAVLNSSGGGATGGAINLGAVTGAGTLEVNSNSGGGIITIGSLGGSITTFTITDSAATTITGTTTVPTFVITDTTGTVTLGGDATISTALTTAAAPYNVAFNGSTNAITGATTFLNTGSVTFGNGDSDSTTFSAALTATAPSGVFLRGTVAATTGAISFVNLTLNGDGTVSAPAGAITVTGPVTGATETLTVQGGSGATVELMGNVNLSEFATNTSPADYLITFSGGGAISNNTTSMDTTFSNTDELTFSGSNFNFGEGIVHTAGSTTVDAVTLSSSGNTITLGAFTATGAAVLDAMGGGDITVGAVTGTGSLTVDADTTGTITIASLSLTPGASQFFSVVNSLNTTVTGAFTTPRLIIADTQGGVTFSGDVTMTAGPVVSITTAPMFYDIAFDGTTNVITTAAPASTVVFQNTKNVFFGDDVGDTTTFTNGVTHLAGTNGITGTLSTPSGDINLLALTLDGDSTLSTGGGTIDIGSGGLNEVVASSSTLTLSPMTGTVTVDGVTVLTGLTTSATAFDIAFNGGGRITDAVTFTNTGNVTFASSAFNFDAGVTHTAGDTTVTNTSLESLTPGGAITLDTLLLNGSSELEATGAIAVGAITGPAANLTINTGTSFVSTGAVSLLSLSTGTTQGSAYPVTLSGGGTIALATTFENTGLLTIDTTSPFNFTGGVTHTVGPTTLDTVTVTSFLNDMNFAAITVATSATLSSGGGDITTGAVTGAAAFTVNGGAAGDVTLDSLSTTSFTITDSASTTVTGLTTTTGATTITDTTGTVTFGGAVSFGSIVTTPQAYAVTFSDGGTVGGAGTFSNSGLVSFAGSDMDFAASLTHSAGPTLVNGVNVEVTMAAGAMDLGAFQTFTATGSASLTTSDGVMTLGNVIGTGSLDIDSGTAAAGIASLASISAFTVTDSGGTTVSGTTNVATVTLTDTTGAITFDGGVTITTLNTTAMGYSLAFNDGGTVTNATDLLNTGTLTIGDSALDSLTFSNGLTVTGPSSTTLSGTLAATVASAGLTLKDLTLATDAILAASGGAISTSAAVTGGTNILTVQPATGGSVAFGGPVTAQGFVTSATGGSGYTVAFNSGSSTITNATTMTNTGLTTFAGTGITFTNGITHTAGTTEITGITVTTTNSPMSFGTVTLSGAATALAAGIGDISLSGTVTGASPTTFTATGGTITQTQLISLGSGFASLSGSSAINLGANVTTTGGAITLLGPQTNLTADVSLLSSGGDIDLNQIDGAFDLIANAGAGMLDVNAPLGGVTPLDTITLTGAPITLFANTNASGGTITFASPVVLAANTSHVDTGSGIFFLSTVDGGFNLDLTATTGAVSVTGAAGGTTPLNELTVSSGTTTTFSSSIDTSDAAGAGSAISITSGGATFIAGTVTTDAAAGLFAAGNLTIMSGGTATVGGAISALGGTNGAGAGGAGGVVSITSTGGNVAVANIVTSGGGATTTGGAGGNITLAPNSAVTADTYGAGANSPDGIIVLSGTTYTSNGGTGATTGLGGVISFAPAGRTSPVAVATIHNPSSGGALTILSREFVMGVNEAMTIFGDVTIDLTAATTSGSTTVTLSDIVAIGAIEIAADTGNLIQHANINIIDENGSVYISENLHFLTSDPTATLTLTTTNLVGTPPTAPGAAAFDLMGGVSDISTADLLFGSTVLNFDLHVPIPPPEESVAVSAAQIAADLQELNFLNSELFYKIDWYKQYLNERPTTCELINDCYLMEGSCDNCCEGQCNCDTLDGIEECRDTEWRHEISFNR